MGKQQIANRYTIEDPQANRLGQGGMGEVFRATDRRDRPDSGPDFGSQGVGRGGRLRG